MGVVGKRTPTMAYYQGIFLLLVIIQAVMIQSAKDYEDSEDEFIGGLNKRFVYSRYVYNRHFKPKNFKLLERYNSLLEGVSKKAQIPVEELIAMYEEAQPKIIPTMVPKTAAVALPRMPKMGLIG